MKTSKRIRDRKTFVSILIIGLLFLLFSLLFSLFFALLTGDVVRGLGVYSVCMYGIPSVLLLVGAVGTIITYVKPFIECMEIGIDAHGKRYLVANNANWFFENLSYDQIKRINDRIVELETWKERKTSSFKSEKKRIRFI